MKISRNNCLQNTNRTHLFPSVSIELKIILFFYAFQFFIVCLYHFILKEVSDVFITKLFTTFIQKFSCFNSFLNIYFVNTNFYLELTN